MVDIVIIHTGLYSSSCTIMVMLKTVDPSQNRVGPRPGW